MAGPINFTINYTCSPNAISGVLEYRRLQPDGTWTNWIPNLSTGNPFAIDTQGGTVLNQTLSNISGNGLDFIYNTTYDFRIKQNCTGNTTEYSNISDPVYQVDCPEFNFLIDLDYTQNSGYALIVRLYNNLGMGFPINPNTASITEYIFDIKTDVGGIITSIGSFTVPVTSLTVGAPYFDFPITSDDLSQPIESLATYYLDFSFNMQTGEVNPILQEPCSVPLTVTTPSCSTYRIYANEFFIIEYTACNGVSYKCGTSGVGLDGYSFYLCSQTQPRGYSCLGGVYTPTTSRGGGGITVGPDELFVPGVTPFAYFPDGVTPAIAYGALIELVSTNACDPNFNGNLFDVTTAQVGTTWYGPTNGPLPCNPPLCAAP